MEKQRRRILRYLEAGPARLEASAEPCLAVLADPGKGRIAAPINLLRELVSAGLVVNDGVEFRLVAEGRNALKRQSVGADRFRAQHGELESRTMQIGAGMETVTINLAESPLAALSRLRTRSGRLFLEPRELRAGERLRSEFTRGQMQPRLGVNWQTPTGSGKGFAAGSEIEITEAAMSARKRVERALDAVGPELSGVLVDVCCFLKGMATIESERGWPVRSAKVVLKAALAVLSRHYEPEAGRAAKNQPQVQHWGAPGYRPKIAASPLD